MLPLVDHVQDVRNRATRDAHFRQELLPSGTITDSNHEIRFAELECAKYINAQRDELDIRSKRILTDDVAIELKMFAQAAALLFFVAKKLADGKPFERFLEFAFVRGDDAGERGRQLGAHGDFTLAFVS